MLKEKQIINFTYEEGENKDFTGKLDLVWPGNKNQSLVMFDLVDLVLIGGEEPLKFHVNFFGYL